ncbi:hypothetical protein HOK31_11115, partial [Candidatus Poribacteria bacterium]|nr:hypothetical protein [Candidatus Poribacteria bacterium]
GDLHGLASMEAHTDSVWTTTTATVLLETEPAAAPTLAAYNGSVASIHGRDPRAYVLDVAATTNPDPNSYDKTLLTVHADATATVLTQELADGPIYIPDRGMCIVAGRDDRDYAAVAAEALSRGRNRVRHAVEQLPEQTWSRAWSQMPPKQKGLYLPLAVDGGRHKFAWNPDGSFLYRADNARLIRCPGTDTPRLSGDAERLLMSFGLSDEPVERTIQDECVPIGVASWDMDGARVEQTAFVTTIGGTNPDADPPAGDAPAVLMARFVFENPSSEEREARLLLRVTAQGERERIDVTPEGAVLAGVRVRALLEWTGHGETVVDGDDVSLVASVPAGGHVTLIVKAPFLAPEGDELGALGSLDFAAEHANVAGYWRRRLGEGSSLLTPEPMLNEFYRAHAGHLLINCDLAPGSKARLARVGSFSYGVFGNEACMMILDLDRRGYHREARACLDALLAGQGTEPLPGNFSSHEGVLYAALGYEQGGYNQHHGWILRTLVEHFRFTRDDEWLRSVADQLVAAADWISRERERTLPGGDAAFEGPGAGLLPHGSLEDIGSWWQWLSTNVYTWRGLDAAGYALNAIDHPAADRISHNADDLRAALLDAFNDAMRRSPVVRLRDGTSVPHFPSRPRRRGRSFGWICEVLEGAIHLLITGLIDPASREAEWILDDYEDNLYISDHYGYAVDDYDRQWFDRGGFSLQACLLLGVEPYLYRDDVKGALRALFNATAAYYYADTRMITEHALTLGEWRGDHYKSSDEANVAGWLRYLFVREDGDDLILGQAVPREWLAPGNRVGIQNASTHFGPMGVFYESEGDAITARVDGPTRNAPNGIRLRFRPPHGMSIAGCVLNGQAWAEHDGEWVHLPGDIGKARVRVEW